jgi:hypothetical protein
VTVYDTYEGTDGPEKLTSNTIHPFFVVLDETTPRLVAQSAEGHIYEGPIKGGAWVDAAHLRPGHSLRTPDGTLRKVLTVNITAEPLTAYNLTVDQTETYFVGEEPVWVHNACDVSKQLGTQEKTYQTYTKTNPKTGEVYTGRTSGYGTPEQNVARRDANHAKSAEGFGPAVLDKTSPNKAAIRGREQKLIEANGGARRSSGTSGNEINGIAEKNDLRDEYLKEAAEEFEK